MPFPVTPAHHNNDRLGFALFLALTGHALVIFGIGFGIEALRQPPILEVTLATRPSSDAPDKAQLLAQHNQKGDGGSEQLTPPQPRQQQATTPASANRDSGQLTTLAPSERAASDQRQLQQLQTAPLTESLDHRQLQQQLLQQQRDYQRLPRTKRLTTASTRSAIEASYMHRWIQRIEQVGNQHYPDEARRRQLYGSLQLAVTVLPSGKVHRIEVVRSSGQRVLDRAAIAIVRRAAPFHPFGEELASWDRLEIIRTWRFEAGNTLHTE